MSMKTIMDRAGKFVVNNSPSILTTIGVTGALTTAYLAGRASFKAAEIIAKEQARIEEAHPSSEIEELTTKDKFELVWKLYIPAAGTFVLTAAAIIMANRIGTRRAAALAAAYSLSEKMMEEYKKKVVEKIGESKERQVRDELAQDRVDNNPISSREVIITGKGEVLCYDAYTGRYFNSSMENLRRAENELNHAVVNNYYASLSDFYDLIGLPRTSMSDQVGWNSNALLALRYSSTIAENDIPCIVVEFTVSPIQSLW